jgi:hypothetical protein
MRLIDTVCAYFISPGPGPMLFQRARYRTFVSLPDTLRKMLAHRAQLRILCVAFTRRQS